MMSTAPVAIDSRGTLPGSYCPQCTRSIRPGQMRILPTYPVVFLWITLGLSSSRSYYLGLAEEEGATGSSAADISRYTGVRMGILIPMRYVPSVARY